ncbi:hypothetical protein QR98_0100950 [Sarcoptes scabiei]|uniref:Uncharacterized protein n=1 Tax=Sarcoptes scabiei TaxID=52283 RepID=A0A132AKS6_SARSC|nr:hypothetical protein QR98_0100950 [Sarcoptes scabiei]
MECLLKEKILGHSWTSNQVAGAQLIPLEILHFPASNFFLPARFIKGIETIQLGGAFCEGIYEQEI